MQLWQEGLVDDYEHQHHSKPALGMQREQVHRAAPSHSDCCSESALSLSAPSASGAVQHRHVADVPGQAQSDWRLQQEHQSPAAASLPLPQLKEPAHLKSLRGTTAGSKPSTEAAPSRADYSLPMALISASLPVQQPHNLAVLTAKHEMQQVPASAQPALPTGQEELHHPSEAAQAKQQNSVGPVEISQQQQKTPKFVAVHGNYHRYYGTRIMADFQADPRLKVCPHYRLQFLHAVQQTAVPVTDPIKIPRWVYTRLLSTPSEITSLVPSNACLQRGRPRARRLSHAKRSAGTKGLHDYSQRIQGHSSLQYAHACRSWRSHGSRTGSASTSAAMRA